MGMDCGKHPCFDADARHKFGRVHLPVAPRCNLGCNFCNRKYDCLNESRPGVTSTVLSPRQALSYLEKVVELAGVPISVVGIAGPGDPFANARETMQTLRLVRGRYPQMLLCVASNGLSVGPWVDELAELSVSHVTLTINAVDPAIAARIYRFVRPEKVAYRGEAGARLLLSRQLDAVRSLKEGGVTVKVNTIVMPGVNDRHVEEVSRTVAGLGADVHNLMALLPVEGTEFESLGEPSAEAMAEARRISGRYLPQMSHCSRCRADAVGLLGEQNSELIQQALLEAATGTLDASHDRPFVAVASLEGMLVNLHLGQAEQVWVMGPDGIGGYRTIETRPTPLPGGGDERWRELGRRLADCRSLVCSSAGARPAELLASMGVRVQVAEGLVADALEAVYAGRRPTQPTRVRESGTGCDTDGVGCGGCNGPGTGCG